MSDNIEIPIWDQYDNVISDPDLEKGYLHFERVKIEEIPQMSHYEVKKFHFDDGTSYSPTGLTDPHVEIINQYTPSFKYIDVEGTGKTVRGQEIIPVIDQEAETIYQEIYRYIEYTEEEYRIHQTPKRVDIAEANIDNLTETTDILIETTDGLTETTNDLIEVTADLSGMDLDTQVEEVKTNVDDLNEAVAELLNSDVEERVEENASTIEDILLFIADLAGGATEEEIPEEETLSEETTPEESSDNPTEEEIPAE